MVLILLRLEYYQYSVFTAKLQSLSIPGKNMRHFQFFLLVFAAIGANTIKAHTMRF